MVSGRCVGDEAVGVGADTVGAMDYVGIGFGSVDILCMGPIVVVTADDRTVGGIAFWVGSMGSVEVWAVGVVAVGEEPLGALVLNLLLLFLVQSVLLPWCWPFCWVLLEVEPLAFWTFGAVSVGAFSVDRLSLAIVCNC